MMAYKISKVSSDNLRSKWTHNVSPGVKRRQCLPIRTDSLDTLCKMPSERDVLGRYLGLYNMEKSKDTRLSKIIKELLQLWTKLNFPVLTQQRIKAKLNVLINTYEKKRRKTDFENVFENLFDITKESGDWLSSEDKALYNLQLESKGKIGYTTSKAAPLNTIHPRKRFMLSQRDCMHHQVVEDIAEENNLEYSIDEDEIFDQGDCRDADNDYCLSSDSDNKNDKERRKRSSTKLAANVTIHNNLSTRKTASILNFISNSGVEDVPTPSQSGIWKRIIRNADECKAEVKTILQQEKDFCLHFDGAKLAKKVKTDYQVVCLSSSTRNLIRLGILTCVSGSSKNIFEKIKHLLDEYNAWSCIKMVITDSTAVNTGIHQGLVIRLKNEMTAMGLPEPQFIACQHHVLDLTLRHVLDDVMQMPTTKPQIDLPFIDELQEHYQELQASYVDQEEAVEIEKNPGWRSDFKFLYELCEAFKKYEEIKVWPKLKFRKLPAMHNARWNSKAIYTLLAYFLLPNWRKKLQPICHFIANEWKMAWFSDQRFNPIIFHVMSSAIRKLKNYRALHSFERWWNQEPSVLDIPRSNMVCERCVKEMEEVYSSTRNEEYLSAKFIVKNSLE